jgi:endonuclease/exonuclease/phosphatase family metal-dependent hydrolase
MWISTKRVAERNGPDGSRGCTPRDSSARTIAIDRSDEKLIPHTTFSGAEDRPFHLDYCFVPRRWQLDRVLVGNYADWASLSDHRPVVVDVTVV